MEAPASISVPAEQKTNKADELRKISAAVKEAAVARQREFLIRTNAYAKTIKRVKEVIDSDVLNEIAASADFKTGKTTNHYIMPLKIHLSDREGLEGDKRDLALIFSEYRGIKIVPEYHRIVYKHDEIEEWTEIVLYW